MAYFQARKNTNSYADLGPVYAAPSPVVNSFGAEVGIVSKDERTGTVQRTGIGFYLRSDHIYDARLDACTERF